MNPPSLALSVDDAALVAVALDGMAEEVASFAGAARRGTPAQLEAVALLKRVRALRARLPVPCG